MRAAKGISLGVVAVLYCGHRKKKASWWFWGWTQRAKQIWRGALQCNVLLLRHRRWVCFPSFLGSRSWGLSGQFVRVRRQWRHRRAGGISWCCQWCWPPCCNGRLPFRAWSAKCGVVRAWGHRTNSVRRVLRSHNSRNLGTNFGTSHWAVQFCRRRVVSRKDYAHFLLEVFGLLFRLLPC